MKQAVVNLTFLPVFAFIYFFPTHGFPDEKTGAVLLAPVVVFKDSAFLVEVKIVKGNLDGFARVEIKLPEKFSAQSVTTSKSLCEADAHVIKFIWMQLPAEKEFSVSFRLSPAGNLYKTVTLNGHFAYVENNQRKMISVVPVTINFSDRQVTSLNQSALQKQTAQKTETKGGTQQIANVKIPVPEPSIPDKSVFFSVQIASSSLKYPEQYFKSKGISDKVRIEEKQGQYKYLVGEYTDYASAARRKEELAGTNHITGAFIVAYKGDKRVPVSEVIDLKK